MQPGTSTRELSHTEILEVLVGLLAALFTTIVSSTIVANALPTIIADLEGSQSQYTWVVTSSLLAMTVSTPVWGKLADLVSKKVLVQGALVAFVVASVGAGFSHDVPTLLAWRTVQGAAAGGIVAVSQAIIASVIPPRQRGRYAGYLGGVMALGTVSGPLLGGLVVDSLGWRWTFFVCVPLAVLALAALQRWLRLETIKRRVRIDYLGVLLIGVAASLPLLWVTFAGDSFAWVSWPSAAFVGGTVVATVLAVLQERRHPEPVVSPRTFRDRTTVLATLGSVAVGIAMFGGSVFLGQYFQVAGGHSPTEAGLLGIPLMLGSVTASIVAGRLITRTGHWKRYLVAGSVSLLVGLGLLATISHTTPEWHVMVFMVFMGAGMGTLMQNYVLAVQNTVDVTQVGAASAGVAFFRSLGGAVGVSVLGAILAEHVRTDVAARLAELGVRASGGAGSQLDLDALPAPVAQIVREAYGDATGTIFLVAAGVAVVSVLCSLAIREVPLRTSVRLEDRVEEA